MHLLQKLFKKYSEAVFISVPLHQLNPNSMLTRYFFLEIILQEIMPIKFCLQEATSLPSPHWRNTHTSLLTRKLWRRCHPRTDFSELKGRWFSHHNLYWADYHFYAFLEGESNWTLEMHQGPSTQPQDRKFGALSPILACEPWKGRRGHLTWTDPVPA